MTEDYQPDWLDDARSRWQASGRKLTPAELCPDDPDRQRRVQEAIDNVLKIEGAGGTASATAALPTGAPTIPGFEITGELGRGGMGVVYKARQLVLNREVAVKLLLTDRVTDTKRLLAEAEAVARAKHQNVVQVHGTGEVRGRPYLVLEFCDGGTLGERLKDEAGKPRCLAPTEAATVIAAVADGVAAAHAKQVVHRDLKPGNVLFAGGVPKVADFGLAKFESGADLTPNSAVMGTPAYMAPEQAGGRAKFLTPAADVWALGVMLYEGLAGRRPFVADGIPALLSLIQSTDPPGVRSTAPGVPRELELIVAKCLRKEPAERYPTATELSADLRRWERGEPVTARPVPTWVRARKWVRRNPLPTGLAATVLVALSATVVALSQLLAREREATAAQVRRVRDGHLNRAKLAGQRGQLAVVVDALDDAGELSGDERLDRLHALFGLARTGRFERELAAVDPQSLPPPARARLHLLRGEHLLGTDDAEAARQVNAAVALKTLAPADAAFAAGLFASDAVTALGHFSAAYQSDPYHLSARRLAMLALLVLGRTGEVVAAGREGLLLYQGDPNFAVLMMVAHGLRGEEAEATRLLGVVHDQFSREHAELATAVVPLLGMLRYETVFPADNQALKLGLASNVLSLQTWSGLADRVVALPPAMASIRLPPALRPAADVWRRFAAYHLNRLRGGALNGILALNVNDAALLPPEDQGRVATAAEAVPEGMLLYIRAYQMWQKVEQSIPSERSSAAECERFQTAAAAAGAMFERSHRADGHIMGCRLTAADMAINSYTLAGMPIHHLRQPVHRERMAKALVLLKRRVYDPEWERLHFPDLWVPVRAAVWAGDVGLAAQLLRQWKPQQGQEFNWWLSRALVLDGYGAHRDALSAVAEARKLPGSDPGGELGAIERRCRAALGLPELAPAPRPTGR